MENNSKREKPEDSVIANTLSGERDIDVKSVFMRANQFVKGNFSTLFQGVFVLFLAFVMLGIVTQSFITLNDDGSYVIENQSIIEIAAVFVLSPLITGLYMLGVAHARREPTNVFSMFSFLPIIFVLALTQLIISIVVQLGLILLVVPGVYVWMASIFSLMLVSDKQMTPIRAIILSCKVFNVYWTKISAIFAVFVLLFITAPLTFGLSLVWVLPLYFSVFGLLYNDLFGSENSSPESNEKSTNESTFDA
ncbi:stress protein [Alteromonas sp.]|nr:stress protein [Alteromonas sp.]